MVHPMIHRLFVTGTALTGLGSLLSGTVVDGKVVVDATLVVVCYYVAIIVLRMRDDIRDTRSQLIGTHELPGIIPRMQKEIEALKAELTSKD